MTFVRQRWRRHVPDRVSVQCRTLNLQPTTIMVASTDYVNRAADGSYINPHLYRVPVSVSFLDLLSHPVRNEPQEAPNTVYGNSVWSPVAVAAPLRPGRST